MGLKNSKPKVDQISEEKPDEVIPEEKPEEVIPEEFKRIDENDDELMTWNEFEIEFEKKHGRKMDRNDLWAFLAMDKDGDTNVSLKEWNAYHSQEGWD